MDVHSLSQYIASLLHIDSYDDCAINGIQVEGSREISTIATAVTINHHSIRCAIDSQADILVAHHGLFVKPGILSIQGVLRDRLYDVFMSGMHIAAYHLPLDGHVELGNNWSVARLMGWKDILPFGKYGGVSIGVRAQFAPIPVLDLLHQFQGIFGSKGIHIASGKDVVSSCAFVSGGGKCFFEEAVRCGVDCFVTGAVDERTWDMAHEYHVHCMAFGHIATEKMGVRQLGDHVADHFGLVHIAIDDHNPL